MPTSNYHNGYVKLTHLLNCIQLFTINFDNCGSHIFKINGF